jgi:hypothetical protein|tara:strand:- start:239 stop:379 length:141 start_codon:yes stop_codon:yes gene_type:complete
VLLDLLGLKETLEALESKGHKETLELKVILVILDLQDQQVLKVFAE